MDAPRRIRVACGCAACLAAIGWSEAQARDALPAGGGAIAHVAHNAGPAGTAIFGVANVGHVDALPRSPVEPVKERRPFYFLRSLDGSG